MPLQKNQILTLRIERLSSDGSGVAHSPDGETVFVPGAAPGDEADVRIVKDCKRYAFGILDHLRTPSPDRIPVDCAVAGPCGGCSLRHLDYTAELRAKQENVTDAFRRIGGLDVPVLDICPSPEVDRYRNKVQFPVGLDKNGNPCIGFYAGRTHRIVLCPDCKLQPGVLNDIGNALCRFFAENGIQPYNEETGQGLVRHIFLRRGAHSGQIMVCLVCTRPNLPHADALCTRLREQFADIATILLNVNSKNTNVILGTETHTLYGPGYIEDTLCGVPVQLGPLSFYQVNTLAAERLYGIAAQYAQLTPDDLLLDLYCGMGTIGLSMVDHCRELVGVEIVPEAIESAKANAARMGDAVAAKSCFFCADAGQAATRLAAEGLHPDVVMLDPPRKGCDEATLSAVVRMAPRRVVYVSCNPATAARDAAWLENNGYHAEKVQPVDLFPRTKHCEAVLLLSKLNVDHHIEVEVSMDELDVTAAESRATYNEIREHVWEHHQLKVSNLYIAQVKQKHGIIERVLSSLLMAFAPGLFLICAAVSAVFRLLSGECAVQQHFHTGHAPAEGTCGHRGTSRPEFPFPARAAGPVRAAGAGQCRRPARLPAGGKTHRCRCGHLCPLLSDQDVPAAAARGAGLAHRVAFSALAAGRCGLRGRYRDWPTGTSPHPAAVLHGVCPAGRRRDLSGRRSARMGRHSGHDAGAGRAGSLAAPCRPASQCPDLQ